MKIKGEKHLFFDADDTLWENHILFLNVINLVIDLISPHTEKKRADLEAEFYEIQHYYLDKYGYGMINFIPPIITLLGRYYPLPPFPEVLRAAIKDFRFQMTSGIPPLIPGIEELLRELAAKGYKLHLLTKGNFMEQMRKMKNSDLVYLFDEVNIVAEKSCQTYLDISTELDLHAAELTMIGNSLRSDVLPALEAGWQAIWFKREFNWHFEEVEMETDIPVTAVSSLKELSFLL